VIVDTNALSAFSQGNLVVRELIAESNGPYLPVVVYGELRFGLLGSRQRDRGVPWLDQIAGEWVTLNIELETAKQYSEVRQWLRLNSRPIPVNDIWIAALARQHAMPLLTNDTHFAAIPGVDVVGF